MGLTTETCVTHEVHEFPVSSHIEDMDTIGHFLDVAYAMRYWVAATIVALVAVGYFETAQTPGARDEDQ